MNQEAAMNLSLSSRDNEPNTRSDDGAGPQQAPETSRAEVTEANWFVRSLKCEICEKYYATEATLKRHKIHVHDQVKFDCEHCDKRFTSKSDLTKHTRLTHEGKRDHECVDCGKAFTKGQNLLYHRRVHHDGSPGRHACDLCESRFHKPSQLMSHKQQVHRQTTQGGS